MVRKKDQTRTPKLSRRTRRTTQQVGHPVVSGGLPERTRPVSPPTVQVKSNSGRGTERDAKGAREGGGGATDAGSAAGTSPEPPFSLLNLLSVTPTAVVEEGETGVLLPNNQRQHRTLHIQKDVLPYALCSLLCPVSAALASIFRMVDRRRCGRTCWDATLMQNKSLKQDEPLGENSGTWAISLIRSSPPP